MENFSINGSKRQKSGATVVKATSIFAIALLIAGAGFFGGMQFQKNQSGSSTVSETRQGSNDIGSGPSRQGGQMMNGTMGEVTAVSSASITVKDERSSSSVTYTVSDSTAITEDGSEVTIDDVQTGDTVMISADDSDSTLASSIQLNPTMGMGNSGAQSSSVQTKTN